MTTTLDDHTDYILRNLPDRLTALAGILASAKKWRDVERVQDMLKGLAAEVADDNARRAGVIIVDACPTVNGEGAE